MADTDRLALGGVFERRKIGNPWQDHIWVPFDLIARGRPRIRVRRASGSVHGAIIRC